MVKYTKWTCEEVAELQRLAPDMTLDELCPLFPQRSRTSIKNAAVTRGLVIKRGLPKTRHYIADKLPYLWRAMKQRCSTSCKGPKSAIYVVRGVRVCEEWHDYANFKAWALTNGYVDGMSIDRIDEYGDYCPDNCRWLLKQEHEHRRENNVFITAFGETKVATLWTRDHRCARITSGGLLSRIRKGWPPEAAITLPKGSRRPVFGQTS